MKNQALKCSLLVRNIPLENFRLHADGRKWKQAARSRSELLLRLSSYANGDGTFTRDGKNYSPSFQTIAKHVAKKSFYRVTGALRDLGLLSWTRAQHYERRIYTIHLPESGIALDSEQVSDSNKSGVVVTLENRNQVSDSPEQVSHSPKTGVVVAHIPSLPFLPPSAAKDRETEREPSAANQNLSPSPDSITRSGQEKKGERNKQAINSIIERAKELSDGKAQFSKTAKTDLLDAIRDSGYFSFTRKEIDELIRAKLEFCKDATSFTIFGSSLAADFVASVRELKRLEKKKESKRLAAEWEKKFRAIWDDLSIDLNDWWADNPPPDSFDAEPIDTEATEYRQRLLAKRNLVAPTEKNQNV